MASDKLDDVSFGRFLGHNNPFCGRVRSSDLTGYALIAPAPIASLAACLHSLAHKGQRARVLCPDPKVHGYFIRAGFFTVVEDVVAIPREERP